MSSVPIRSWLKGVVPAPLRRFLKRVSALSSSGVARLRCAVGVAPLSERWGQRGKVVHRYYLEKFLEQNAPDIRGRCLEFQEDSYSTRFGKNQIERVDILNLEPDKPGTTIIADLTAENDIPSDLFDCVICTYVLHVIFEKERVVSELHRILKPGGTLLVAVPNITIHYPKFPELWRFTAGGLHALAAKYFGSGNVVARGYGNSLVASGELRGLAVGDFAQSELDYNDSRYSLIVCARAVKQ